jgi:hypothetical protein
MSFVRRPGWDGYRAKAVTQRTCKEALSLLTKIRAELPYVRDPRAAPATSGAVSFYWRSGDEHFTLRVHGPREHRLTYARKRTGEASREEDCTAEEALQTLRDLFDAA